MISIYLKDIWSFFSNITGYIILIIFLVFNSLFLWVFPGEFNVMDVGTASLDTLFILAPWIFLFLVPAATMRLFSEEQKSGTLELILTRPVSELQIVLAKYFAAVSIILLALIPSLVFYFSVYLLGSPVGSIDTGATWGAYLGLFFLGSVYASIGVFASSLTENQIVAFLIAVIISFIFFTGFDSLGTLAGKYEFLVSRIGINEHYKSISRGVVDSRDIIYFLCVNAVFLVTTRLKLESNKW